MSYRHKILGSAVLTLAIAGWAGGAAVADDALPLAQVARELGFTYTYLPYENAVSLSRTGATIVVRPGDAFFSANERREPVYGVVPFYQRNDVYVSRAFVEEIRNLGTLLGPRDAAGQIVVLGTAPQATAAQPPRGSVTTMAATYDATNDTILVRGRATAGAPIALAVRATLSENLPVISVDRAIAYAGADGAFVARLTFGSGNFAPARFIVAASGAENVSPVIAEVPPRVPSPAMRTEADRR